jgi:hypothetical protein
MAILINDNLNVAAPKPIDNRYGPYNSLTIAKETIPSFQRHRGLVVGIVENGDVVEYWFKSGINDLDLELKTIASDESRITINANATLASNKYYILDSSAQGFTVALPASPIVGDFVWLQDPKSSWASNNITVNRNGNNILAQEDNLNLNVDDSVVILTYVGNTIGWDVRELTGDYIAIDTYIGATGPIGSVGATGSSGKTAYEIAVDGGFLGSEYDWLHTLPSPTKERINIASSTIAAPVNNPYNINIKNNQAYLFLQGFSSDFSLNFRGDNSTTLNDLLGLNEAVTCAVTVINSATPYKLNHIFIDGVEVPLAYWYVGADAVAYEASSLSIYIVKRGTNQYFVTINQAPLQPITV